MKESSESAEQKSRSSRTVGYEGRNHRRSLKGGRRVVMKRRKMRRQRWWGVRESPDEGVTLKM